MHSVMIRAWDDFDPEGIVWMPAHCSKADIGIKELGNGEKLTAIDLAGNAYADTLAKEAAHSHRVPEQIRTMIALQAKLSEDTGKWIGLSTWLANNQTKAPHRDSTATLKATRLAKHLRTTAAAAARKTARIKREKLAVKRPYGLGGHSLIREVGGGWRCEICRSHAKKWSSLAPGRCSGSAVNTWANAAENLAAEHKHIGGGHVRMLSGQTLWCWRCGGHASNHAKTLKAPCTGTTTGRWVDGQIVHSEIGRTINLK